MRLKARNRIVTAALLLLVLLVVFGALFTAPPARADEAFRLSARSAPLGLATDQARGRYWMLERSSGTLTLTALASNGTVEGQMTSRDSLTNAQALAFVGGQAYIGDVGGRRASVTIYQVTEPWPRTEILKAIPYALTYPDGPHEAAAILVDANHRLHVVTAGTRPGIYQAQENPPRDAASPLTRIADAPAGVTDATVLLDGRIVLRTSTKVSVLDGATRAPLGEVAVPVTERGQALTQGLGAGQVITAAGPAGEVSVLSIPGAAPTAATVQPTRRAPVTEAEPEATRTFEQTGTTVALVAALILAFLAAAVVMLRR